MSSTDRPSPSANSPSESSSPPTIIGSFEEKLYVLELHKNVIVETVQASVATTKNTPLPELLFCSPIREFVEYADHFLEHPRLKERLLDSRTISAKRPEIKQDNETGVVLTSMRMMGRKSGTASDRPKVSWVHEGDDGHGFMEQGLIRKVLLGWLIKAFEDAGIEIESQD